MRYNTLGRTGLFVSELCFGSMTFGGASGIWEKIGRTPQQEADRLTGLALDAGQSERYGCIAAEFVDEHHALPACYARIFARFWAADGYQPALVPTTKIPAGLYVPD